MDVKARVEGALERHLDGRDQPPMLGNAMRYALFPGGARVRPSFAVGVALACGDDRPMVADALAVAVECLHCASLVHDDLPCFDDAAMRRGKPSVHARYGEAMAVLVGDGLIVLAFQVLSDVGEVAGDRLAPLLTLVSASAGMPGGLVSGQAMEGETDCALSPYHAAKTGALFEAAAAGGAVAAGGDVALWRSIGAKLGAAYQIADDIHDRVGGDGTLGKPTGQDALLGRPNTVDQHGLIGAVKLLKGLIDETVEAVPEGTEASALRALIGAQTERFVPKELATAAA
ncbi:MAG: polyprenyl synthetase family protein [Pseudomonadota bacterium]